MKALFMFLCILTAMVASANTSIVGSWCGPDDNRDTPQNRRFEIMADGTLTFTATFRGSNLVQNGRWQDREAGSGVMWHKIMFPNFPMVISNFTLRDEGLYIYPPGNPNYINVTLPYIQCEDFLGM